MLTIPSTGFKCPSRREIAHALVHAWRAGELPPEVLDDWRIHPATLAAILPSLAPILDVGAGPLTLSRALRGQVISVDIRPPARVRADARALPFRDGAFPCVVSRMFFGAPVSQAARRIVASGDVGKHAVEARAHELRIWHELRRVSAPGALHMHHILERTLYSTPPGFEFLWPLDAEVPLPPTPSRNHPFDAFLHHLSGVILLRAT